jgi:VCBS repeat-containing protein
MSGARRLMTVLALVLGLTIVAGVSAVDITVDDSTTYQTMSGFGTCLPGWSPTPWRSTGPHQDYWQDLGASILRIDMDAAALNPDICHETITYLGPDIDDNIALMDFDRSCKGLVSTYGPIAAAAATMALDDYRIFGSVWTPPSYMKTGWSCVVDNSAGGSLIMTPENLTQFGRYMAAYVKGWSAYWGVPMDIITVQNEPGIDARYNSCVYAHEDLPVANSAVRAELDANNIECDILTVDGPWYLSCWDHYKDFMDYVLPQRTHGLADIDGWAVHMNNWSDFRLLWDRICNGGCDPQHGTPCYENGLADDGLTYTWMTEESGERCSWSGAMELADNIHSAIYHGNCDAFIYWLAALGSRCRTEDLTTVSSEGMDTTQDKYSVFKHYCRYIRPGAVRIGTTPTEYEAGTTGTGGSAPGTGLCTLAFKHPANETLAIVLNNQNGSAYTASITLNTSLSIDSFDAWRSSSSENFASVGPCAVNGGVVSVQVPASSVVTLFGPSGAGNTPPVANDDSYAAEQDVTLSVSAPGVLANDTDAQQDPLQALKVSDPSHGSVTLNSDGSFDYIPDPGYTGNDSFTYKANDGLADSNVATVAINVASTGNTAPVANDDGYFTGPDTVLQIDAPGVLANDTDAEQDPLQAIKVSDSSHGSVSLSSDGSFDYTPDAGYTGADSFTYKANDGELDSNVATVSITVSSGGDTMHVHSITVTMIQTGPKRAKGHAEVVIKDATGAAVQDATVTGSFTGDIVETHSGVTDQNGLAIIESNPWTKAAAVTFCVDEVTHATLTYAPAENVETCDSSG